jgi:hypothetical protein
MIRPVMLTYTELDRAIDVKHYIISTLKSAMQDSVAKTYLPIICDNQNHDVSQSSYTVDEAEA